MLSVRAHMVLSLADARYRYPGDKVAAMYDLGYSQARFWVAVNKLLADPEAEAEMPAVVHRLRRLRDKRAAVRGVG